MTSVLLALGAGLAFGRLFRARQWVRTGPAKGLVGALVVLLIAEGAVAARAMSEGHASLRTAALAATVGGFAAVLSAAVAALAARGLGLRPAACGPVVRSTGGFSFALVGLLACGAALGVLAPSLAAHAPGVASLGLLVLVGLVGVETGALRSVRDLRAGGGGAGAAVFGAVVGSALIGVLSMRYLGRGSLAAALGLGWYTAAGPLLGDALGDGAAVAGLVVNLGREVVALALAPYLVRLFGVPGVTAAAGAAAMDVALPVLTQVGGERASVVALSAGLAGSTLAPILMLAALP